MTESFLLAAAAAPGQPMLLLPTSRRRWQVGRGSGAAIARPARGRALPQRAPHARGRTRIVACAGGGRQALIHASQIAMGRSKPCRQLPVLLHHPLPTPFHTALSAAHLLAWAMACERHDTPEHTAAAAPPLQHRRRHLLAADAPTPVAAAAAGPAGGRRRRLLLPSSAAAGGGGDWSGPAPQARQLRGRQAACRVPCRLV